MSDEKTPQPTPAAHATPDPPLETIRAGGFVVVDNNGIERVCIGTNDEGQSGVRLHDQMGRLRMLLAVNDDGITEAHLLTLGSGGVSLVVDSQGGCGAEFTDRAGKLRARVGLDAHGVFHIYDYGEAEA